MKRQNQLFTGVLLKAVFENFAKLTGAEPILLEKNTPLSENYSFYWKPFLLVETILLGGNHFF